MVGPGRRHLFSTRKPYHRPVAVRASRPPDEAAVDPVHAGDTEQGHGAPEFRDQQAEQTVDTPLATGGQRIEIGAADGDGIRAQGQGLGDMGAAPHAAVHDDLQLLADRLACRLHHLDRGRGTVQLAPAMVGEHHGGGAMVHGATDVIGMHHALDRERPAPQIGHPLGILPRETAVELGVEIGGDPLLLIRLELLAMGNVGETEMGIADRAQRPSRVQGEREQGARGEARRQGHSGTQIPLAVAAHGRIHRHAQGIVSGRPRPFDKLAHQPPVPGDIDLEEPRSRTDGRHLLQARGRDRGQTIQQPVTGRRPRHRNLALVMEQPRHAGRGQQDGGRHIHAQHPRLRVNFSHVHENARHELVALEGLRVPAQRPFVIRAAFEIVPDRQRQPPPRNAAKVRDIVAMGYSHGLLPSRQSGQYGRATSIPTLHDPAQHGRSTARAARGGRSPESAGAPAAS